MIVCYYALGERDKMKRGFQMLVEVPLKIDDEDKYSATSVSISFTLGSMFLVPLIKNFLTLL